MIAAGQFHSVEQFRASQRRWTFLGVGALALVTLAATRLLATSGSAKLPLLLLVLAGALIGAGILWRQPTLGAYLLVFACMFIDQWPVPGLHLLTGETHFFQTISAFTPLPLPMMPADLVLLFALTASLLPGLARSGPAPRGGTLFLPVLAFLAAVIATLVYGYAMGPAGTVWSMNAAWAEARAFVQMVLAYFVACNLITDRKRLETFIWVIIVALGLKGIQGINSSLTEYRYGLQLEAITGHEDVVFFATFFLLLAGMKLFGGHERQQLVMLGFLGPVLFTELATGRRSAFFVLGLGFIVLAILLYRSKRQLFLRLAPPVALLLVVYTAVFWNFNNNPFGQPVRAFKSQFFEASERDRRSDVWRDLENINLAMNIRSAPVVGLGFGRPYHFYIEIPSLESTGFIYWIYMNHNAVFWVWMKMGFFGFAAFWYVLGSAVVQGLIIFRRVNDGYLKSVALMGACLVLMQIFFSYGDLGLTYSRSMIYVGLMMGVLAALPAIAREPLP
ncbi:MAG: O-antigen ligase family protein, partial [Chloroflexota bacterium]|nr:O-antigen ligase family protein [Chloroflexota bacterium]